MSSNPIAVLAAGLIIASSGAHAQAAQQSSHNPAVKNSRAHTISSPAHGANSFTQDQAKGRLAKAGYTNISKLTKDKSGAWRGTATKDGKNGSVGLDYKGNIVTR